MQPTEEMLEATTTSITPCAPCLADIVASVLSVCRLVMCSMP